MNLLKADAMAELKYFRINKQYHEGEPRFLLCRHYVDGGGPSVYLNGKAFGLIHNAMLEHWFMMPKTEAEAWEHLPNYLKDDADGTF